MLKNLLVRGSSFIHRQLLQSPRSHFFGSLTIVLVFHPPGCLQCHISAAKSYRGFSTSSASVFRSRLTSISSSVSWISAVVAGSGLLKMLWKCFFRLDIFSFSSEINLPNVSFTC